MIEQDTVKLLRECDAGVEMGTKAIEDVLDRVQNGELRQSLTECRQKHEALKGEIRDMLGRYQDEGKEPPAMARGMAKMKTDLKIGLDPSDETIADLMTDGCNMGVKSLSRYLNQYQAADEASKNLAKRLTHLEEQLAVDIRRFL